MEKRKIKPGDFFKEIGEDEIYFCVGYQLDFFGNLVLYGRNLLFNVIRMFHAVDCEFFEMKQIYLYVSNPELIDYLKERKEI